MSPYWHHIESDIQIEVTSCKVNLEGVEFTGRDGLGRRRYSFLTAKQLCYNSNFGQVHWIPLRISDPQIGCCAARSGLVISGFYFHKILETQNRKNELYNSLPMSRLYSSHICLYRILQDYRTRSALSPPFQFSNSLAESLLSTDRHSLP